MSKFPIKVFYFESKRNGRDCIRSDIIPVEPTQSAVLLKVPSWAR